MTIEGTRRGFLGGAIALLAASTFIPRASALANMPRIVGDGVHDDAHGLGALFRNEPVIFPKEKIGVDAHKGIQILYGRYLIGSEIIVPDNCPLEISAAKFVRSILDKDGKRVVLLPENMAYFSVNHQTCPAFANNFGAILFDDHPRILRERGPGGTNGQHYATLKARLEEQERLDKQIRAARS